jgi:hypothetical protein
MKSMARYSASAALIVQIAKGSSGSSSSEGSWGFRAENQLNAVHIGSHEINNIYGLYMTHNDSKHHLDCEDDEIRRAQNENSNERIGEYAFPASICSLELDSPV